MKKIIFTWVAILSCASLFAQKYAYVDSEYILNNIPSYKSAQETLDQYSEEWQKEIEEKREQVEKLYKDFQAERVLLSEEMKKRKEDEIIEKEAELRELQQTYFGRDGELIKKQQELVKPIQDLVYNAIKELSEKGSYAIVFDTSSGGSILYSDPKNDKSDEVLKIMGYKN